jgi:hypothetical protein
MDSSITLDDIPLDAEYEGLGPMFLWDAGRNRWVDWRTAEFRRMTPDVPRNNQAAAGVPWDQIAILSERISALLLFCGIPVKCRSCGAAIVWVRSPSGGDGKGFNTDGAVHDEVCAKRPAPVEASGPLFRQSGD